MSNSNSPHEARVAVLVDCDNVPTDIVEHALLMVAQFGRVVLRRGYGNHNTLANKWQEVLVRQAFTPCLQYQYASGKNTADIALALDALEALFDSRADTFCLVTSDSDFSYLCRKLRERGATVFIVGEPKTPDALRNACDQFFEWERPAKEAVPHETQGMDLPAVKPEVTKDEAPRAEAKPLPKRRPPVLGQSRDPADRRHLRGQGRTVGARPIPQTNRPVLLTESLRPLRPAQHGENL